MLSSAAMGLGQAWCWQQEVVPVLMDALTEKGQDVRAMPRELPEERDPCSPRDQQQQWPGRRPL